MKNQKTKKITMINQLRFFKSKEFKKGRLPKNQEKD